MVRIEVAYCGIVADCRKCLAICPVGALMKVPVGKMKSFDNEPDHIIRPYYEKLCTGCGKCVSICPKKAIKIND